MTWSRRWITPLGVLLAATGCSGERIRECTACTSSTNDGATDAATEEAPPDVHLITGGSGGLHDSGLAEADEGPSTPGYPGVGGTSSFDAGS